MNTSGIVEGGIHSFNFRRNDNDRRAPREVVTARLLGDPSPTRLEDAAAIRTRLEQRRERTARSGTYQEVRQQQAENNRTAILETLSLRGAMTTTELIRHTGVNAGAVIQHLTWLERQGTVRRTTMPVPQGQIVIVGLTNASSDRLDEVAL